MIITSNLDQFLQYSSPKYFQRHLTHFEHKLTSQKSPKIACCTNLLDSAKKLAKEASVPEPETSSEPEPETSSEPEPESSSEPEPENSSTPEPEGSSEPAPEITTTPKTIKPKGNIRYKTCNDHFVTNASLCT